MPSIDAESLTLLHHGEVQMAGSMFRKKGQYLVLTNAYLLRFKNQNQASEVFPEIPSSIGRNGSSQHLRKSFGGTGTEYSFSPDPATTLPLENMVAAYKLDDGRPYFTIEMAQYDEASNQVSTMTIQLNDPRESDLWLMSIRAAITKVRLTAAVPFGHKAVEYAARALEYDSDYDPNHFRMFTVAQRAPKLGSRSSSDDLGKLMSTVCYLVIGLHKIHLVPLPRASRSSSNSSMTEMSSASYGLMALTSIHVQSLDDTFQMSFRTPLHQHTSLYLASSSVNDVALCIRQAADFLRPNWVDQPFVWNVPQSLDDALLSVPPPESEDHLCFDRTLIAYCVCYNVDPSYIRYTVNYSCEDGPEFDLLSPNHSRRSQYSSLELLAILRALRYNESFHAVSFRNAKLDALHGLYDRHGSEHFMWTTKSGQTINLPRLDQTPLIVQELQCLVLKSTRLRRLNFSGCLSRKPKDLRSAQDPGSGICEAIFPLCALQLTNVDWIVLSGIALSEIDIEYLYAAAIKKSCHFRGLDLGRCGLSDETLNISIQSMVNQGDTLESLDISGNPARLNPHLLGQQLQQFNYIRRLDLSKVTVNAGLGPILEFELLMRWKLEYLSFSATTLNTESVDSLSAYLMSDRSNSLRELHMEQCQMSGEDVATILESLTGERVLPRHLHLFVSENRVERKHEKLVRAIARSRTPTHLTMQMLEYSSEKNFRNLIDALSRNTSLHYLDISRVSLPLDASEETCERLRLMFESNNTLTQLNISGEQAHLEAVTLGRGLPNALRGLEKNKALAVLHVEHQILGLPGASALASVLERNTSLRELYCEHNEINLQAFTTLINAVRDNTSLCYLPAMDGDQAWSRSKVDREVSVLLASAASHSSTSTRSTVRRALSGAVSGSRSHSSRMHERSLPQPGVTEQDVQAAVASLDQKWIAEIDRLHGYLSRNYCLANGLAQEDLPLPSSLSRPATAASLSAALRRAAVDRTPTAELNRQLGGAVEPPLSPTSTVNDFGDDALAEESDEKAANEADVDDADEALMMGDLRLR